MKKSSTKTWFFSIYLEKFSRGPLKILLDFRTLAQAFAPASRRPGKSPPGLKNFHDQRLKKYLTFALWRGRAKIGCQMK